LESDEPGVLWEVTADFQKFSGGNAVNAAYQLPTAEVTSTEITLKFRFKHYAHVTIDGGDVQNIIPLNYGVAATRDFAESEQLFPELEGIWSFVYKFNDNANLQLFAYSGHEFYMSKKLTRPDDNGTKMINYSFLHSSGVPEAVNFAHLQCNNPINVDTGEREVTCYILNLPAVQDRMVVAPGDIGPDYIFAENENGDTFEAFRYNYLPNFGLPEPEPE